MKDNKWYIEQTEKLKSRLNDAFKTDVYAVYNGNVRDVSRALYSPLPEARDIIMRFMHLVYSYDNNLPLNADLEQLRNIELSPMDNETNVSACEKTRYFMDFFIEYLTDFAKEGQASCT